jgi:hypothetical protein
VLTHVSYSRFLSVPAKRRTSRILRQYVAQFQLTSCLQDVHFVHSAT